MVRTGNEIDEMKNGQSSSIHIGDEVTLDLGYNSKEEIIEEAKAKAKAEGREVTTGEMMSARTIFEHWKELHGRVVTIKAIRTFEELEASGEFDPEFDDKTTFNNIEVVYKDADGYTKIGFVKVSEIAR